MTPEEHLAEADKMICEAADMPLEDAAGHLAFADFHIRIAYAAAAVGVSGDLGRFVDLTAEAERDRRAANAAAAGLPRAGAEQ